MKILYKRDSKGKTRYLRIYTKGADLIQESGLLLTSHPNVQTKTCKGKNVGRSNETTPEEQAIKEAAAKITDKLTEGYFETIEEMQTIEVLLPMLAKDYKDEKGKVELGELLYLQPKLDGMRCLAYKKDSEIILKSRDGKMIQNMDHIKTALHFLEEGVVLDGELYVHGKTFQENMELIKKYRPGLTESISYHIYDCVDNSKGFHGRFMDKNSYVSKNYLLFMVSPLTLVPTICEEMTPDFEVRLKEAHTSFVGDGFEGTIVRRSTQKYEINKRSSSLLKYKDFQDVALKLLDVLPAEQRPEWGVPVFEITTYAGLATTFRANTRMTHEARKDLLTNKNNYIGKTGEIRFFEMTDDGIPRFPVLVGFRLDK